MKDKQKVLILAGMFAVTNMGQKMPETAKIARAIKYPPSTPNSAALTFAEQYMETNEHERIFTAEVRSWVKELTKRSDEDVAKTWPDAIAAYDTAKSC